MFCRNKFHFFPILCWLSLSHPRTTIRTRLIFPNVTYGIDAVQIRCDPLTVWSSHTHTTIVSDCEKNDNFADNTDKKNLYFSFCPLLFTFEWSLVSKCKYECFHSAHAFVCVCEKNKTTKKRIIIVPESHSFFLRRFLSLSPDSRMFVLYKSDGYGIYIDSI